jgi:hypothetical protein
MPFIATHTNPTTAATGSSTVKLGYNVIKGT